jgi:hypothetical protein
MRPQRPRSWLQNQPAPAKRAEPATHRAWTALVWWHRIGPGKIGPRLFSSLALMCGSLSHRDTHACMRSFRLTQARKNGPLARLCLLWPSLASHALTSLFQLFVQHISLRWGIKLKTYRAPIY